MWRHSAAPGGSDLPGRKRREGPAPGMDPAAEHQQQLRSLRDFLLVYNRMTELCFQHCVSNLNYRLLTGGEERCLDGCAGKLVHANHRLMRAYVGLMPSIMQRRAADYEASVAPAAQGPATEGAGAAGAGPDPPATPSPDGPSPGAPGTGT